MAEFVWYHVEGYTTAGCFFAERFESLEDAWAYYGADEDWQEVDFTVEKFFSDHHSKHETIKRIGQQNILLQGGAYEHPPLFF